MNNIPLVFWLIPIASIVALGMAWFFFRSMMREEEGTDRMKEIAAHVRKGAMAYLKQQYKVVTMVFIVLAIIFAFMAYVLKVQNPWVPFAFLTGGLFSGLAGFFGMKTATYASARTANGARTGLDKGLKIAFRSGAVMGLVVVGLGLLDIAIWFIVLNAVYEGEATALVTITTTMLTFGMGASTQALFARVGGGIYTKAADVGADLVGKVEANIPEDDPRNPATIADNVGDNVGDVAGMGADLYESYCGSILSTAALGATAFAMNGDMQLRAVIAPMVIAAIGIFLSLIGIFLVRTKEGASMKELLHSLGLGTNVSAGLIAVATFVILYLLGIENWLGLSFSVISGLVAGVVIGQATEYYTSQSYRPTQKIAEASQTGPATVIIKGIGTGMISTMIPVVTISVAIMLSYLCANGFDMSLSAKSISIGLYGIGIAAVGMLSTLGITLATDAEFKNIISRLEAGGNAAYSGEFYNFQPNVTYYWRATARDHNCSDATSTEVGSFQVDVFRMIYPATGAAEVSLTPTLECSNVGAGATYTFLIDTSNSFSSAQTFESTTPTFTVPKYKLAANTTYYVMAQAKVGDAVESSDAVQFTTKHIEVSAPQIVTPEADGVTLHADEKVVVAPMEGIIYTRIGISASTSFPARSSYNGTFSAGEFATPQLSDVKLVSSYLTDGKTYYVRAQYEYRGVDGKLVTTDWTTPRSFVYSAEAGVASINANGFYVVCGNNAKVVAGNEGLTVEVFATDGKLVMTTITSANGEASLAALASGSYLVKVAGKTAKLVK